jgi:hypothetical protein
VDTLIQRVLLAVAVLCGALAIYGSLPAAVVTGGVVITWAIYSAAWLMSRSRPR